MSREVWATYSVKDHLKPRNLAADILLFDRLVFPVPCVPDNEFYGYPDRPIQWSRDDAEWQLWEKERWDPDAQQRLLEIVAPVAQRLPWTSEGAQYEAYQLEAAEQARRGVFEGAFVATRTVLTHGLPAYVNGVAALGPMFERFEDMKRELKFERIGPTERLPESALATVLSWKFFAPDPLDERFSDLDFIKETVDFVTGDAGFRKKRRLFHEWQQGFIKNGATDQASINRAVAEMTELSEEMSAASEKLTIRRVTRFFLMLAPQALGLIAAGVGLAPLAATGIGTALSVGSFAVDEKFFKEAENGHPAPAAFVRAAQDHFGLAG